MPLPVLKGSFSASNDDLIRFFHKIELQYVRHLGEETQLDCGTAIANANLKTVNMANGIVDAAVPPESSADAAIDEAYDHFNRVGSSCRRWILNPSLPIEQTAPLVERLLARGYVKTTQDILHLPRLPQNPVREVGGLRIIPARASYKHARMLAEESAAPWNTPELADAAMMHLDDPHYESILALQDGSAIAVTAVLGIGELAGIQELFVTERMRRKGIGRTMMSRALEICVRSLYRHILLSVDPHNAAAQTLYRELGFEKVGAVVEFNMRLS